ncbi:MAG: hypothetical protein KAT70_06495 [Thermoplasmata archaeon]|nr:hypothetical protein [Thermoplasmata archaeon]
MVLPKEGHCNLNPPCSKTIKETIELVLEVRNEQASILGELFRADIIHV